MCLCSFCLVIAASSVMEGDDSVKRDSIYLFRRRNNCSSPLHPTSWVDTRAHTVQIHEADKHSGWHTLTHWCVREHANSPFIHVRRPLVAATKKKCSIRMPFISKGAILPPVFPPPGHSILQPRAHQHFLKTIGRGRTSTCSPPALTPRWVRVTLDNFVSPSSLVNKRSVRTFVYTYVSVGGSLEQ